MHKTVTRAVLVVALGAGLVALAGQPGGPGKKKPEAAKRKLIKASKGGVAILERDAAERVSAVKKNGVELAIKLKGIANKGLTDLEVAWTITYKGPRSPLVIVKPSFDLPTGQTLLMVYAAPKGKDYAYSFPVMSPTELIVGPNRFVIDRYGVMTEDPLPVYGPTPELLARTKDWFVTVPKGKPARGILTVSGADLKRHLLTSFPGEFDPKQPHRLFVALWHIARSRGEAFSLDSWVGDLYIPTNAVPGLASW